MSEHARSWQGPSAQRRLQILQGAKSIAIVGASDKSERASYFVSTYLLSSTDFEVHFVNPVLAGRKQILGREVLPSLAALRESGVTPDIVDVFRKHDDLPTVLQESIDVGAGTIWLQLGLWHEGVAAGAEKAGMAVVMDRCLKIEHARFHGGLHLAGFDTGVIDSRR
ncbi:CoA-binding protein [Nakamurella sp. A5-74]|uniref:CoA-binding protein n=1 Tax=Nakamurella sp. A5-74 TaxID=3158264 RepID=A0AAU8DRA9_9ACTN